MPKETPKTNMTKEDVYKMFEEISQRTVADIKKENDDRATKLQAELEEMRTFHRSIQASNGTSDRRLGINAARFARCVIAGKGNADLAIAFAKKLNDPVIEKALQEADFESGGAWLPEVFSAEFVALLREESTVLALQPTPAPMPGGNLTLRKATSGATAYWIGEGDVITPSQPGSGQVKLTAKELATLVPISNKLLNHMDSVGFEGDELVLDDMMGATTEELDLTLIRSPGTLNRPKGLLFLVIAANKFDITHAGAAATLDEITADLAQVQLNVETAKIKVRRPGWIFAPRTKWHLRTIRDANGQFAFKEEMDKGELFGAPFKSTSQIPINLNTDESEVYFADFARLIVGRNGGVKVDIFDGGAYSVSGSVVSGISQNETIMRTIMEIDLQARYDGNEIGVLTAVDWGA